MNTDMHPALDVYEHWPPSDTNAETDTDTDTVRHEQEHEHGDCALWWKRIFDCYLLVNDRFIWRHSSTRRSIMSIIC